MMIALALLAFLCSTGSNWLCTKYIAAVSTHNRLAAANWTVPVPLRLCHHVHGRAEERAGDCRHRAGRLGGNLPLDQEAMKYRTLNLWFLKAGFMPGLLWVRLFGPGLLIKDVRRHPLMFSQRGRRHLSLGNWKVFLL